MMGKASLTTPSKRTKEVVAVDFLEIDEIRYAAREWIKEYRTSHPRIAKKFGRAVWENSSFYIGRTLTRVTIHRVAIPHLAVFTLAKYLKGKFPEYTVGVPTIFGSLSIKLR